VMISGLVLAAGESRRMGSPKPLKKIAGKTFLWYIINQLKLAQIRDVVVVLGSKAENIQSNCGVAPVRFVVNHNYHLGQFSSLQTGIRSLDDKSEGALVCLVDQPHIKADWIQKLIAIYEQTNQSIIVPVHQGRRGHPVFYSSSLFAEICAMAPTVNARTLYSQHSQDIAEADVEDAGILLDVDTPDDMKQILSYFKT